MVAMKLLFSLFTLSFIALVGLSNAQQIVVDFSPDTTGVTSFAGLGNGYDFSVTVGESFILDQTTTISGGSFFGETGGIFGDFGWVPLLNLGFLLMMAPVTLVTWSFLRQGFLSTNMTHLEQQSTLISLAITRL